MFKIQFRNSRGRLVSARCSNADTIRQMADKARREMPETHELRVRRMVMDDVSGDFIWADCTADFTR
ncbi:hypothetical protein OHT52_06290 [Streptomyces sp. NBC_00247]|uniref:hypothetical protein n=1 Tax=Streptomyces sp. NBC_00247 TaxID=2975689 RepID=UPI002E2BC291|nr:hypothetical protein [Streptomyces sp. NBC_00247]